MAASELLKLWARPPTVSPRERRSCPCSSPPPLSATRRDRSRAQLLRVRMERSISTLVRAIWRAMSWISSWSVKRRGFRGAGGSAPRPTHLLKRSRTRPTRGCLAVLRGNRLEIDQLGHALAMPRGVAEREFGALGPLEVQVEVVLPGEADAAVELYPGAGHPAISVRDIGFGHAHGQRPFGHTFVHGPRRVVRDGLAVLDIHEHVGGFVLDALIRADGPAEGLPDLRVLDGHVEHFLRAAAHLRAQAHRRPVDDAGERRPARSGLAHEGVRADGHVLERDLAELARLVHGRQEGHGQAGAILGYEKERNSLLGTLARGGARRHHEGVGGVRILDEELGAVEGVAAARRRRRQRDAAGSE